MLNRLVGYCLATITINCLFSSPTLGATATASLNVTTTVGGLCVVLATDVAFGATSGTYLAPVNASTNGTNGSITATCTYNTGYTIAIGSTANANVSSRRMVSSGNYIAYSLYSDSGYSTAWGNGTNYGTVVAGTGTGLPVVHTVYGQIPIQSPAPAGVYADLLVPITVTY